MTKSINEFLQKTEVEIRFCRMGFDAKYASVKFKEVFHVRGFDVEINDLNYLIFVLGYGMTDVFIGDVNVGQYSIRYFNDIMHTQMYFNDKRNRAFESKFILLMRHMLDHIMKQKIQLVVKQAVVEFDISVSNFKEVLMYGFFNGFNQYKAWITPKQQAILDAHKNGFKIQIRSLRHDSNDWVLTETPNFLFNLFEYRIKPINPKYAQKLRQAVLNRATIQVRESKNNVWTDLDYLPEGELDPKYEYRIKP